VRRKCPGLSRHRDRSAFVLVIKIAIYH
jgi:hypothetical protein